MNIQKMMKEAQKLQAKLQEDMAKAQEALADEQIEGSSGGGLVVVTVNGHKQVISVKIKPEAVDPEDVETLEDLVFAALQAALSAAEARAAEVMEEVQGGLGLPPGMDLGGMLG
ncbi:YbaB/EbfC family nucleoid-associated protein [bacterium]|nr:YbaB/EbfC family nucleoid-associated protein [bacterium]